MSDFYTIGLPRSRSKWLSTLLSYGDSTCFHEHLSAHSKQYRPDVDTTYRGFCDTNPLIPVDYGDSPVVIVRRNPEHVVLSALRCFDPPEGVTSFYDFLTNYAALYSVALDGIEAKNSMTVEYDDLADPFILSDICTFLMPDNPLPRNHIKEMLATRIQTTNRNLTESLKDTANALGIGYKDLIARYDIPTYACARLFDYAVVMDTMNAMWGEIAEDEAQPYKPDLLSEYWIGIYAGGVYVGMFRLHQLTSVCWQGHVFILPKYRKHSHGVGVAMKQWISGNLDAKKIVAEVPECYPNVIGFLEHHGFVMQGFNPDSFNKNGLIGTYQLGMKIEDMK